jgi:hypothetical protein
MTCSTRIKGCVFGLACLTIAPLFAQTAQATELSSEIVVARHTSADSSDLVAGRRADAEAGLARRLSNAFFSKDTVAQVLSQTHDTSAGAVITVDAHDTITLHGVTVAQLAAHSSDFHFF